MEYLGQQICHNSTDGGRMNEMVMGISARWPLTRSTHHQQPCGHSAPAGSILTDRNLNPRIGVTARLRAQQLFRKAVT